ncbi:uncharacterized protein [Chelonus insularis]|uniref:uncharacterized protein n=1 Tax=Chelonus insularis TaxID=460826 RepID=UPI001589C918|nr:uncharacterized protein LOC118074770 [Chelonus insularis]
MSDSEDTDISETTTRYPTIVTKEWLENLIIIHLHCQDPSSSHSSTATIDDFEINPGCIAGESVLSDILAVKINYTLNQEKNQLNVIVKLLPHDPFSRFFVTEAQFHLREIKFYTQVVADLKNFQVTQLGTSTDLPIPKLIHAHYKPAGDTEDSTTTTTPEPPESFLVLENLCTQGFKGAPFSRGLTLRQTKAAIRAIGYIHALSLAFRVKDSKPLSERYPFLFQTARATDSYQQLVERGLPQLARFLERRQGLEDILKALLALRKKTKEIISSLLAPKDCPVSLITHTDFWCNNLLFKEKFTNTDDNDDNNDQDNGDDDDNNDNDNDNNTCECAILDWQMITHSRPTNDIALLIISSVPTKLRRHYTYILLDKYWSTLTKTCQKLGLDIYEELNYSRQDLDKDYRKSQLLALLLCIGSVDVALGDPLTEQRLIDLLQDLYNDGILTFETAFEQQ